MFYLVHKGHLCVDRLIDLECLPTLIASIKLNTTINKFLFQLTSSHTVCSDNYVSCVFHIDDTYEQQGDLV